MSAPRILVTGSSGLIGRALIAALHARGYETKSLDLKAEEALARGDIRDADHVRQCVEGCDGIVQLAAVSRVIAGERDPELCWSTNVDGLNTVIQEAWSSPRHPWLIFASSREVYGQPAVLPVNEDCPVVPVNIYGRSKAEGERLIEEARTKGMRACTIRLSNVFGCAADHADRVIPAFARAAATGAPLRVDGSNHTFDFTHITDVTSGILALAQLLMDGAAPPAPIHFVSGVPTTLGELAEAAVAIAGSRSVIRQAPPRDFDVATFVGDGARAKALLGWEPKMTLRAGLGRLIEDFRAEVGDMAALSS
jgi:nucleoside-diphosphate-sugar epimerase